MARKWSNSARPMPKHLKWVTHYEPGKYDLAILHIDQQCVDPTIGKGWLYNDLNEVIKDIPKIVVCHGTPLWPEQFDKNIIINGGSVFFRGEVVKIRGIKELVGDNFFVVNSYTSAKEWGWGYPIVHGMDPNEWYDLPKEPMVTTMISPAGLDKYYNRDLLRAVKELLIQDYGITLYQITVDFLPNDWEEYKRFLGRSLIYFNPTYDSPMPRSRTEAMLSGCCVVTTKYHEADQFIKNGKNGFIVPDNPRVIADLNNMLITQHYREAVKIGQEGKKTAQKYFHTDRYLETWYHLIKMILNKKKPAIRKPPWEEK